MLIARIILAVVAVGALVVAPRSSRAAAVVLGAAVVDVLMGAAAGPAVGVVAPLVAFLAAALTLAALVERSGLSERAAVAIAQRARGSGLRLYALVCLACALLTAAISLDGAVVLIIPLVLALHRRAGAPFAPLFLGSVVVANVVSIAVPQGNPTNLVVMNQLGLSPAGFVAHMLLPGFVAAGLCAVAVAIADRNALRGPILSASADGGWTVGSDSAGGDWTVVDAPEVQEWTVASDSPEGVRRVASDSPDGVRRVASDSPDGVPRFEGGSADGERTVRGGSAAGAWTGAERLAAVAFAAAALTAWVAPLAGMAPWWPFTGVVAVALAVSRTRPIVPWRIAAQVGGLVVVTQALHLPAPVPESLGFAGFVGLAAAIGTASALANNLPISVWAGSLLASGSAAYAATIGLAVGALATPQGSVATLIAAELAGPCAPKLAVRRLAPLAAAALLVAALVLWAAPS